MAVPSDSKNTANVFDASFLSYVLHFMWLSSHASSSFFIFFLHSMAIGFRSNKYTFQLQSNAWSFPYTLFFSLSLCLCVCVGVCVCAYVCSIFLRNRSTFFHTEIFSSSLCLSISFTFHTVSWQLVSSFVFIVAARLLRVFSSTLEFYALFSFCIRYSLFFR